MQELRRTITSSRDLELLDQLEDWGRVLGQSIQ